MSLNNKSRTVNASKNVFSAIFNKLCILFLTFICRKVFIQYIGVEYLGINGLFSNILTLLSLAELGLGTAMNVSLYKPIAENNTSLLSALLNYYKKIYHVIAVCVMLLGLILMPFLSFIINLEKPIEHLYLYYLVFVTKNAVSYLMVYKASIVKADQKDYLVNRIEIYVQVAISIAKIVSLITLKSYLIYILLEVIGVLLHNIIVSYIADKSYPFLKEKVELSNEQKKGIFSNVASVFLYKVSNTLINGTDNILMSVLVGTVSVGLYSNYFTLTSTLDGFITLLFTSLTAGVGNLIATSSKENSYKVFKTMQMVSFWICGYICICLLFLTQDFIQLWLGKEMLLDNLTLVAIVLNVFFSTCMRPIWTYREGTGMYRQIRYVMVITAVENFILSIILGKLLGISGILFATSISKITTYFWYEPKILFSKFFDKKVIFYYIEYGKNFLVMLLCAIICYSITRFFTNATILNWVIKAILCSMVINVIYFIFYFRSDEFSQIKDKAKSVLRR